MGERGRERQREVEGGRSERERGRQGREGEVEREKRDIMLTYRKMPYWFAAIIKSKQM